MNRYHSITFCLIVATCSAFGQSAQVPLTDLKTTNNPCFQLLDIAPTSVTSPASPKDLGLGVLQNLTGGSSILKELAKNFAVSIAPYWYVKPSGENVFKYTNVLNPATGKKYAFGGFLRKMTLSASSTFNDSTSGSLLKNTNYYAAGLNTNILTLRTKQDHTNINGYFTTISGRLKAAGQAFEDSVTKANPALSPAQLATLLFSTAVQKAEIASTANFLAHDNEYTSGSKNLQNALNVPLFQLDFSVAYSQAFPNNSTSNSRFNRLAGWLTGALNFPINSAHSDYLSVMGMYKLIGDNLLTDTTHNIYQRESANDIGGKLSITMSDFSIGFEGIWRTYTNDKSFNSHRAVGFIQYKVNQNIYLTGSFGQNFGSSNNLFTLLGVNFGFGNKSASLPN